MVFAFVFGAIIGSFLNVVLLRKNTGEGILFQRSRCFSCGKKLEVRDLIPILSFLWQKGRCRYCGSKISFQYPVVEALVGLLAVLIYIKLFVISYWLFVYYFAAFSAFFLIAAYDFRNKIIDTQFLYVFSIFGALEFFFRNNFADDLASSFFISLLFYFLWRFSQGRWMGRGDVNLAFIASVFLGWPRNILMLLTSFWVGGLVGVTLLILKSDRFNFKSELPFGPFLAAATFLVWYNLR